VYECAYLFVCVCIYVCVCKHTLSLCARVC
jgi:hypothetical protein